MTILLQSLALIAQIIALFQASRLLGFLGRPPGAKFIAGSVWLLAFHTLFVTTSNRGQFEADSLLLTAQCFLFLSSIGLALGSRQLCQHALFRLLSRIDPGKVSVDSDGAVYSNFEEDDPSYQAFLLCNGDMEIIEADENACEILNRKPEELQGLALPILVVKDEMLRVAEIFSMARSGDTHGVEWRLRHPDDTTFPVMVKARLVGEDTYRLALRQMDEKPEEGPVEDGYVQVLTSDSYVSFDHDLKILAWNEAMTTLTGIQADQCLREHLLMHFPVPDDVAEHDFVTETLEGLSHELKDIEITNSVTGQTHLVDQSYEPLIGTSGNIVGGKILIRPALSLLKGSPSTATEETAAESPAPESDGEEISLADFLANENTDTPDEAAPQSVEFDAQLIEQATRIQELEDQLRAATEALTERETQLNELTTTPHLPADASDRVQELEQQLNEQGPQILELAAQLNDTEKQLEERDARIAELTLRLETGDTSTEIVSTLENRIQEQDTTIQDLETRLNESEERLVETSRSIADRDARIEELTAHQQSAEQAEQRVEELTRQLDEREEQVAGQGSRIQQLEADFNTTELKLHEAETSLADAQARVEELSADAREHETTTARVTDLESLLGERDHLITDLQTQLADSTTQLETHEVRLGENSARVRVLEAQVDERDTTIAELRDRDRESRLTLGERETRIEQLETQLRESREQLQQLEQQATERDQQFDKLNTELIERNSKFSSLAVKLDTRDDRIETLESELLKRDTLIADLEGRLNQRDSRIGELDSYLAERRSRVAELESRLREHDSESGQLDRLRTEHSTRIAELESRLRESEARAGELESRLASAPAQPAKEGDPLDHLAECVWLLDANLSCEFVNTAWCERTGGTPEGDLGSNWRDRVFGQDRDRVLRTLRGVTETGKSESFECRLQTSDGEYRWVRGHAKPRGTAGDRAAGVVVSAIDVHDHITTEQDLRTTLRWHEWAQKSARLGSWEYHPKDDSGFWNDTSVELLRLAGRPSPQHLNEFLALVHPDDRAKLSESQQRALKTGQAVTQHVFRTNPDQGPVRRLCISIHRAPEEDGSAYFLVGTLLDVTAIQPGDRLAPAQPAEAVAQRSDDRYRKIVELSGQGVWMMDAEGYTSFVNPAMIRLLGRKYREFVGRHFCELLESESTSEAEDFVERRAEGIAEQAEFRLLHRSGQIVNALLTTSPLRDDDGEIIGCLCMVTDLTNLHEQELARTETESRSRAVLDQTPALVMNVDEKKIVRYANRGLPGMSVSQWVGTPLLNGASPADRDAYDAVLDHVFSTGSEAGLVFDGLGADNATVRYAARVAPVKKAGKVASLCVVAQLLETSGAPTSTALPTRDLLAAHESERRDLATDLTDVFAESLDRVRKDLEALPGNLSKTARKRVDKCLHTVSELREHITSLRDRLRPPVLDDLGLGPALKDLVSRHADSADCAVTLEAAKLPKLDPNTETAAYRIVEAALRNALQHAKAKSVSVDLRAVGQTLEMSVRDDGKGFNPDKLKPSARPGERVGIPIMTERANLLGGGLEVTSRPREGTTVSATLPLAKPKRKVSRRKK